MTTAVISHWTVGTLVGLTGTFTDANGNPVDPTDARVDVLDATNTTTTYAYTSGTGPVTRVSTGVYAYDADTTGKPGRWQWRWWSPPGAGQTADAGQFIVSAFPAMVD